MVKKRSWDDIPSLGLQLEKDNLHQNKDNRAEVRLLSDELLDLLMLETNIIAVQIAGVQGRPLKGLLLDINQKGMGVQLTSHDLKKNDPVVLGTMLGRRGFKTKAVVRWTQGDKIGVEYVDPRRDDYFFLSELYGAKVLNSI